MDNNKKALPHDYKNECMYKDNIQNASIKDLEGDLNDFLRGACITALEHFKGYEHFKLKDKEEYSTNLEYVEAIKKITLENTKEYFMIDELQESIDRYKERIMSQEKVSINKKRDYIKDIINTGFLQVTDDLVGEVEEGYVDIAEEIIETIEESVYKKIRLRLMKRIESKIDDLIEEKLDKHIDEYLDGHFNWDKPYNKEVGLKTKVIQLSEEGYLEKQKQDVEDETNREKTFATLNYVLKGTTGAGKTNITEDYKDFFAKYMMFNNYKEYQEPMEEMKGEYKITCKLKEVGMNMTQVELSEKVGITPVTMNKIINNKDMPSFTLAYKISKVLGRNIEELFDIEPL